MGTRSKCPPKTRVMPPEELQSVAVAYRNGNRNQRRVARAKLRVHVREASGMRQDPVWNVPPPVKEVDLSDRPERTFIAGTEPGDIRVQE